MFIKKAIGTFGKIVRSPVTGRLLHTAKVITDVGGMIGIPGSSAISKGLGVAERALGELKSRL